MNACTFTGRLGADVEIRYTPSGMMVGNFNLAVDRFVKKEKKTTWIRITVWDKKAQFCADYLKKGSKCLVQGELVIDEWTDKEGNKRTSPSVNVFQVELLDPKPKEGAAPEADYPMPDEDVPF